MPRVPEAFFARIFVILSPQADDFFFTAKAHERSGTQGILVQKKIVSSLFGDYGRVTTDIS